MNDSSHGAELSFRDRLRFLIWGVRYLDIVILMAYATMGAIFAIDEINQGIVVRLLVFTLINFLFVAHIYIFNDWSDARLNPEEPKRRNRHALKHPVLTSRQVLLLSFVPGAIALAGFFFLSWRLFLVGLFLELITMAYSHPAINFKGRPVMSTLIHFLGAAFYFMGGWAVFQPFSTKEVCLGVFFGLVLSAGHFSNEIEDFEQDLAAGIRTNAVAFGQRAVFRAGLFLFLLSSAFLVYVAWAHLDGRAYFLLGVLLLLAWLVQGFRYRDWKGGDSILKFRQDYRYAYALLCAALILIRLLEWKWDLSLSLLGASGLPGWL